MNAPIMATIHLDADDVFATAFVEGFPGRSVVHLVQYGTLHFENLVTVQRLRRTLEELEAKYRLTEEQAAILMGPFDAFSPGDLAPFRVPGDLMPDGTVVPEVAGVSIRRMSDVVADWDAPAGAGHDVEADRG